MTKYDPPQVPLVQARLYGSKQRPTAIVFDLSNTSSAEGAALGVANYHHRSLQPAQSHHYIVDQKCAYKGVDDHRAAYSSPRHAISFLLCAEPKAHVGEWDEFPELMHKATRLAAQLCLHHKIRPRYLDSSATDLWLSYRWRINGGLIVRTPGAWPYETFMNGLQRHIETLKA